MLISSLSLQADLSIADPAVSAPQRISSSAAVDTPFSASQDVQVQRLSPASLPELLHVVHTAVPTAEQAQGSF